MAGGKADAVDAVDGRNQTQQVSKVTLRAVIVFTAPGVYVLAQQVDLTYALRRQLGNFKQNIVARTADFLTTGVRHHAVGAVFIAAFHD